MYHLRWKQYCGYFRPSCWNTWAQSESFHSLLTGCWTNFHWQTPHPSEQNLTKKQNKQQSCSKAGWLTQNPGASFQSFLWCILWKLYIILVLWNLFKSFVWHLCVLSKNHTINRNLGINWCKQMEILIALIFKEVLQVSFISYLPWQKLQLW